MLHCRFLLIVLIALVGSGYGSSLNNLPTFKEDRVEETYSHLIPVYNFSFYPSVKKPIHLDATVPSSSTDPVVMLPESIQKCSTGLALLYIASKRVRVADHKRIASKLIRLCNSQPVELMTKAMLSILVKQDEPVTIDLLMPSYIVHGWRSKHGRKEYAIQQISACEIITLGKGCRPREIAYQKWLALSNQIGNDGGMVRFGAPNMLSPCVQLTDISMSSGDVIKDQNWISYKVQINKASGYSMKTAPVTLSASTCDPEKTAALLRKQILAYNESAHIYIRFLYSITNLVLENSFLGSVTLTLSVEDSWGSVASHRFNAFRENGFVKGWGSHMDTATETKYPLQLPDTSTKIERLI